jgi:hypothetical protein
LFQVEFGGFVQIDQRLIVGDGIDQSVKILPDFFRDHIVTD